MCKFHFYFSSLPQQESSRMLLSLTITLRHSDKTNNPLTLVSTLYMVPVSLEYFHWLLTVSSDTDNPCVITRYKDTAACLPPLSPNTKGTWSLLRLYQALVANVSMHFKYGNLFSLEVFDFS